QDPPQLADLELTALWSELQADFTVLPRTTSAELCWAAIDHLTLHTDRRKLKIILKNLVGNALKFTPNGTVSVHAVRHGGSCIITVIDTGLGIPRAHLPHHL